MSRLREHELDEDPLCAECRKRLPVGPCASCESMICGECGVLTKDPNGTKCICHSCARLIASVGKTRTHEKSRLVPALAAMMVLAFLAMIIAAFAR